MIRSGINYFITEDEEANQNYYWGKPFHQVGLHFRTQNQTIIINYFTAGTDIIVVCIYVHGRKSQNLQQSKITSMTLDNYLASIFQKV